MGFPASDVIFSDLFSVTIQKKSDCLLYFKISLAFTSHRSKYSFLNLIYIALHGHPTLVHCKFRDHLSVPIAPQALLQIMWK